MFKITYQRIIFKVLSKYYQHIKVLSKDQLFRIKHFKFKKQLNESLTTFQNLRCDFEA